MKYKPYPKYKDSGVEWLGEIPEGWNTRRIGYHFIDRREKVSDKDYPALSVSMQGVVPQLEHVAKTEDNDNRKLVKSGDLVINSRSDRKGASGLSQYDGSVSLINTVLIPDQSIYGWFAHHVLRSKAFQEEFYRYGKGIVADLWSTNFNEMKDICFPIPSLPTQRAIAAFLDAETARIDGLIKDYEELIELLKEKRQALISHAVTRGLSELVSPDDPEFGEWYKPVKYKDSGVEWIGEIPEGWEVIDLKYASCLELSNIDKHSVEGEPDVFLCNYTDVYNNDNITLDIQFMQATASEDQIERLSLKPDDVVITKDSESPDDIGIPAYVVESKTNLVCGYHLCVIRAMKGIYEGEFLYWFLRSNSAKSYFYVESVGMTRYALGKYAIANIVIPLPPLSSQNSINNYLDRETSKLDTLVTESQSAIELLKEHRSALITNAVTGKINVENIA